MNTKLNYKEKVFLKEKIIKNENRVHGFIPNIQKKACANEALVYKIIKNKQIEHT